MRNQIADALFALGSTITWGSPTRRFLHSGRRLIHWTECPAQPAFYQVEHNEPINQSEGTPARSEMEFQWVVYQSTAEDRSVAGAVENNLILDALQPLFRGNAMDPRQRLGGLVHRAFIQGTIFKDGGDLDGQGVIVVPIRVILP